MDKNSKNNVDSKKAEDGGDSTNIDIIYYIGQINYAGYNRICKELKQHKLCPQAILVIDTPGGDPDAGFRIARAMQHHYESFSILVPRLCKSAGTLLAIGAYSIYMNDMSELGPLDVQILKPDELYNRSSGLEIITAFNNLQTQAYTAFAVYLQKLSSDFRLSTKMAGELSIKFTTDLYQPLMSQIDPLKLAENQRANDIGHAYGKKLNEKSDNLHTGGLARLVTGYPSHAFVIDRKEARSIFRNVFKPSEELATLSENFNSKFYDNINSANPVVKFSSSQKISLPINHTSDIDACLCDNIKDESAERTNIQEEKKDANVPNSEQSTGSSSKSSGKNAGKSDGRSKKPRKTGA